MLDVGNVNIAGKVCAQSVGQRFVTDVLDFVLELARGQGGIEQVLYANPVQVAVVHRGDVQPLAVGIQRYTVDTGHMVGWEEGVNYQVRKVGNWKSTLMGGEGLVVDLTGPGRVYVQTRSPENFIDWLVPKLPSQRS